MLKIRNFIDGTFFPPESGRYLEKRAPATDAPLAEVPAAGARDVAKAVAAAREAFPAWAALPVRERAAYLRAIADRLEARADEFALAESRDQGKPVALARRMDIPRAVDNFRFFAGAIEHAEETATDMDGAALNYTLRQPVGVAGLITPWNLPLYLLTWKIAPALAVGNAVVAKPSELTPTTAWLLCEVLNEVGLPAGVVNVVHGTGPEAGSALVEHPDVPILSFTGGTRTGAEITRLAAPYAKRLSLELGGKNATLVFADADLTRHLPLLVQSAFRNQGEICLCGSRILVEEPLLEEFATRFAAAARALVVGDPEAPGTDLGPLVSREHRLKVRSYVELAQKEGARVLAGGEPLDLPAPFDRGHFFPPTVLAGLDQQSRVVQDEIFGPVVTLQGFRGERDAIEKANDVRYGLSASVFTRDLARAHRVARSLHVGTVWVETWMTRDLRVPFGGVKASGHGREGGRHSLDFFTETKTVCLRL